MKKNKLWLIASKQTNFEPLYLKVLKKETETIFDLPFKEATP